MQQRPDIATRNQWLLSDAEIITRMNAMNRKAASQPTSGPAMTTQGIVLAQAREAAGAVKGKIMAGAYTEIIKARAELAELDAILAQVKHEGRKAEAELNALISQLDQEARAASRSYSTSTIDGTVGSKEVEGTVRTTTETPGGAAIVDALYRAPIAEATKKVQEFLHTQAALNQRRAELHNYLTHAFRLAATAANNASKGAAASAAKDAKQEAHWAALQRQYPGADVVAL